MALADTSRLIASLELEDKFTKTAVKAESSLGRLTSKTSTLGRVAGETQRGLGNLGRSLGNIATIGAGLAVTGLVLSVRAASDLQESMSKVEVVFGENSEAVKQWASDSATAFGQSKQQALEAAGTFGNLFQAFGLGRDEAQEMSTNLVELAADLASFNNTSVDDALIALRSGLSGETEPLKRFGVAINDARLRAAALRLGLIKTVKDALTPGAKAAAAYALIMEDTALAQGDFARTSDGLANQQRIVRAQLQDTAAVIGTALLPSVTKLVSEFSTFISEHQGDIAAFAAQLPAAFDKLIQFGTALPWDAIGASFELMATGSKALLDTFLGLPPWVQTAVLTGWGLNKLTGGALTGIVGALTSGLIKGVLGINAGVVNINAATVTGGPGGLIPGKPGIPTAPVVGLGALGLGLAGLTATLAGANLMLQRLSEAETEREAREAAIPAFTGFPGLIASAVEEVIGDPFGDLVDLLGESLGEKPLDVQDDRHIDLVKAQQRERERELQRLEDIESTVDSSGREIVTNAQRDNQQTQRQFENLRGIAERTRQTALSQLASQGTSNFKLAQLVGYGPPRLGVTVISNVTISEIQRKITSQQIAIGKGPLEF